MTLILPLVIVVGILAWVLRPRKSPTTARIAAILVTAIPQFVVAIAAIVFQLMHNAAGKTWVSDISNTCFLVGLALTGVAILASAGFAFARKGEIAKGIGFGICIAVIVAIIEFGLLEWLGGV
jgi:ABC-type dipeptide/oligopeptide/nickel transport system permease component